MNTLPALRTAFAIAALLSMLSAHAQPADEAFVENFTAGVKAQQAASTPETSGPQRERTLQQAEQAYKKALSVRPSSIATLNNLGTLYAATDRDALARDYYRNAVSTAQKTNDPKLEGYALNYAEYLETRDPKEALAIANIAFRAPGSGTESRELLGRLYAKADPAGLITFCRALLDEGSTDQVLTLATANAKDLGRTAEAHGDWLIMTAVALAQSAAGKAAFDPVAIVSTLTPTTGEDPAILQLQRAVKDPPASGSELTWWRSAYTKRDTVGTSGRAAMLELLRALGERNARAVPAKRDLAVRYFRAGIDLGERGPDPEAFLGVVNLYADAKDTASLRKLMERYEAALFSSKSGAYSQNDLPLILRLHTTLGLTYAHLNQWDSAGQSSFQNARFQLEAAQNTVEKINRRAAAAGSEQLAPVSLPTPAVNFLSDYYVRSGQKDRSTKLRVEASANLRAAHRLEESTAIVRGIKPEDVAALPPDTKRVYENVQKATPR